MNEALYEHFANLKRGDMLVLFNQELNPPDLSRMMVLEIHWTHDRVDGDLIFGQMDIPEIGHFDIDAYIYRNWEVQRPNVPDSVWLSATDIRRTTLIPEMRRLTGGPLYVQKLAPSQISTRSDRRDSLAKFKGPTVVCFSRDEHAAILRWQDGLREKGFKSSFPKESYVEYKRTLWHSLSSDVESGGLMLHIQIQRQRKGVFAKEYSIHVGDDSFRRSRTNPCVRFARPWSTLIMQETYETFDELRHAMDHAVDQVTQRNSTYLA